mgnify:CR=1 FL=1
MKSLLIRGAQVYLDHAFVSADVLVKDGIIVSLDGGDAEETLDGTGAYLSAGFIDVHTHGCAGVDVNAASAMDYGTICRFEATQGVTSFNASVLTDTEEQTLWCIDQITTAMKEQPQMLGIHLEGPFLSTAYKGAMPESLLRTGDAALLERYCGAAKGAVRYLTISPEIDGSEAVLRKARELGVVVAMGHSGADYETSMRAVANGVEACTHTFNAMTLLHQHYPAIMGAALESDIYCEAICDGRHLHPAVVRLLLKCKGDDRVVAITDSIMAAGLPDGQYKLGVNDVTVVDGDAKLTENGTRAGSTLTCAQALRNIMRFTGRDMVHTLPLLTENPARLMRVWARKGSIEVGKDADMVLLDGAGEVLATISAGRTIYKKEK